jgi:ABC-type transport system involved in multi-copper enzyme maturation permease subunit
MRFVVREIAGWLLLAFGLAIFYLSIVCILSPQHLYVGASILTLIGFIVFRGGIHLLKVAVAARVCMQTQELVREMEAVPKSPFQGARESVYRPSAEEKNYV